jgi:hypothetical protein
MTVVGTPQDAGISPLVAHIYVHCPWKRQILEQFNTFMVPGGKGGQLFSFLSNLSDFPPSRQGRGEMAVVSTNSSSLVGRGPARLRRLKVKAINRSGVCDSSL